jgi:deoxyribonuclease V
MKFEGDTGEVGNILFSGKQPRQKLNELVGRHSPVHSFGVSYQEAKSIQNELRQKVEIADSLNQNGEGVLVGGADVAFLSSVNHFSSQAVSSSKDSSSFEFSSSQAPSCVVSQVTALAAVVIIERGTDLVAEVSKAFAPVLYPYIPGFLSFREGPAVLAALGELQILPDVMLYDGTGIAHPRGFGLASHMALLTGIPSIGCAKSLLCGECKEPGAEKGDWTELWYDNCLVGACVRTRRGVKPIFISPGSGFSVRGAVEFVLSLPGKYRLPEPTRLAHMTVTSEKKIFSDKV